MSELLSNITIQLLDASVLSSLLFLCAVGLTMIWGIMGVINFAHGSFYMLGAYFGYSIATTLNNFWLALIIAPILVGIVGFFFERMTLRFIYARPGYYQLLLTFGILLFIDAMTQAIWGAEYYQVSPPEVFSGSLTVFFHKYPIYRLFVVCLAAIVAIAALFALQKTKLGLNIRAVSQESEIAGALGINVKMVRTFVFSYGCALAGLAGVVIAPMVSASLGMGASFLIQCFAVVIIGGLGSITGSLVGSLIVGASQTWGTFFFPEGAMAIMFILMVLVLILKPDGLVGRRG